MNKDKIKTINHGEHAQNIKKLAVKSRQNATDAEKKFWFALRDKLKGFKFKRQFVIDNKYIVDFIYLQKRLMIELDGGQHKENLKDLERAEYLGKQGFRVVRFCDNEVLNKMNACLEVVRIELLKQKIAVLPLK